MFQRHIFIAVGPTLNDYDRSSGYLTENATTEASDWLQRRVTNDMALITCVTDDRTYTTYFSRPPFHPATLFFEDFKVEEEYRKIAWKELKFIKESKTDGQNVDKKVKILPTAIFDTCFDLTVVTLLFTITSVDR